LTNPVRLVVGESPALLAHALADQLLQGGKVNLVATCRQADTLLQTVAAQAPDLVLLDLNTLRGAGADVVRLLKHDFPQVRVLVLCADVSRPTLRAILKAGADAYVVQLATVEQLLGIVCTVAAGASYFCDEIAEAFREPPEQDGLYEVNDPSGWHLESRPMLDVSITTGDERAPVTMRELEILGMVAVGFSSKVIADRLFISVPTVRKHRENLMRKLGLHNAAAVTAYAIANGLSLPS
jgi:DNA-binding NarL/FixJ family response regulator